VLFCAVGCGVIALIGQIDNPASIGKLYATTLAITLGVMTLSFRVGMTNQSEWPLRMRMALLGVGVAALLFWLDGRTVTANSLGGSEEELVTASTSRFGGLVNIQKTDFSVLSGYALYFAAVLGLCRWWHMAARDRKDSWTIANPIAAGFFGMILMFLWPHDTGSDLGFGIGPLLIASLVIPLVSAWTAPPQPLPRKLRVR